MSIAERFAMRNDRAWTLTSKRFARRIMIAIALSSSPASARSNVILAVRSRTNLSGISSCGELICLDLLLINALRRLAVTKFHLQAAISVRSCVAVK